MVSVTILPTHYDPYTDIATTRPKRLKGRFGEKKPTTWAKYELLWTKTILPNFVFLVVVFVIFGAM